MLEKIADGRTDLVCDLIANGQHADTKTASGVSIMSWCAYYGDVSALRFLLGNGGSLRSLGDNFDLNGAVFHGHWQLCQFLIESGADVNYPLKHTEETPLHAATCKANRPAYNLIIEILLANGADPNRVTKPSATTGSFMRDCKTKAETPLHRAAAFADAHGVQLLLDAGAKIDAPDMNGDTPLSWASWHLRPDAILKKLCYGDLSIHPQRNSTYDHGQGWGTMDAYLLGKPHC